MKRFVAGLILIGIIGACASLLFGRLGAAGDENNFFNSHYRARLAAQPLLRKFFGLHETGDAKSDYLGPHYQNIIVEVDSLSGANPAPTILSQLADRIKEVTGKDASIYFSDGDIALDQSVSPTDVDRIAAGYRNKWTEGNTAVVYLLVLDAPPADDPTLLGETHHEDEIILFTKALRDFTAGSSSTYDNYELSTALHEFGHLLGLPHNERPGCLMNSHAEADHVPQYYAGDVVTDFCPYEKQLITAGK